MSEHFPLVGFAVGKLNVRYMTTVVNIRIYLLYELIIRIIILLI